MSDLPLGWEWTSLGDLCEKPQYGWTTKSSARSHGLLYLRTTDITRGPIDWSTVPRVVDEPPHPESFLLADGDIVVSRAGSVGASALIRDPPPAVFASYLIRLRVSHELDARYVRYFLDTPAYWAQVSDAKVGIAVQNVNAKKLAAIALPLPPRAEQERIVAAIEEHVSRLDAADTILTALSRRLSRLTVAARVAAFDRPWPRRTLCDVAETQLGKMLSSKSKTGIGSTPYLRNRNVRWGLVDLTDVAVMDFSPTEIDKFRLMDGDVLICEGGAGVGRTAIWRGELDVCCYQKALHRVRTGNELLPEFLLQYIRHLVETRRLDRHLSGVAIGHFPQEDLRALEMPVPTVGEQKVLLDEIGAQESVAESFNEICDRTFKRINALRRSILASAFSGKLVPQDPQDEPASVQLERIRRERAASSPAKRTRRARAV